MTTVLSGRRVVLPDGDGFVIRSARLTIDHGRILTVDVDPQTPDPPGTDDLGDALLTPAFVDAHTHLALVGLRGAVGAATTGNVVEDLFFHVERKMVADDVRALTRVGAYEALLAGTAAVWDHYYFGRAVLDGLADVGLAGVVAPALQDLDGPGRDRWEAELDTTVTAAHDAALASRGLGVCLGPHATDTVSDALWRTVVDAASRHGLPIHTHVAQSLDEVRRIGGRASTTPLGLLERLGVLGADVNLSLVHGLFHTDADLDRLDPVRHMLVACPSAQAWFDFPAPVATWSRRGLRWALGTDASATNDAQDVRSELRAVAMLRTAHVANDPAHGRWRSGAGIAEAEALRAVRDRAHREDAPLTDTAAALHRVWTTPGAQHPGLPCGAIAPGHLAHLALWDLEHPSFWPGRDPLRALAFGQVGGALQQVMVAGSWRGARGDFARSITTSAAWRDASREASSRLGRLLPLPW